MVFGTLLLDSSSGSEQKIVLTKVNITGKQTHFLSSFSVELTFVHQGDSLAECKYIFPTDSKICIYNTRFILNGNEIKMQLKRKAEAEKTFEESKKEKKAAVIGRILPNGLSEFVVGSMQPNHTCVVILETAFSCNLSSNTSTFFKFPLEVCTPTKSSSNFLQILKGKFIFSFGVDSVQEISSVKSNAGGNWDAIEHKFSINSIPDASAIVITTEYAEPMRSSVISSGRMLFTTILPKFEERSDCNSDFVFLVDCSGSMSGNRIKCASECLQIFLRSLPTGCFFDIVCFGSSYNSIFGNLVEYNSSNFEVAIQFAKKLQANLGGTEILEPLLHIFKQPIRQHRICQIFVITDGEVGNTEEVLAYVSVNKNNYRIFTVGIGSYADAGLINGLAEVSFGTSVFAHDNQDLIGIVMNQLESALSSAVTEVQLHIDGIDSFEITPFPIPPAFNNSFLITIYKLLSSYESNPISLNGYFENAPVDIDIKIINGDQERASSAMFAFNLMRDLNYHLLVKKKNKENTQQIENKLVELSLESGILCEFTAYIGVSDTKDTYPSSSMFQPCSSPPSNHYGSHLDLIRSGAFQLKKVAIKQSSDDPSGGMSFGGISFDVMSSDEEDSSDQIDLDHVNLICEPSPAQFSQQCELKKEEAPVKKVIVDTLSEILQFQTLVGFWSTVSQFQYLLPSNFVFSISHMVDCSTLDKTIVSQVEATVVALAFLRQKEKESYNKWKLIEMKAIKYLKSVNNSTDWNAIINSLKLD